MFINPAGLAGNVAVPVVADCELLKLSKLIKNCCQARVGLFDEASKNSVCGYGLV
jgi:hypothetical protein